MGARHGLGCEMTVAQGEVKPLFLALPAERKVLVLALWAHHLTVAMRGWYPGQAEPDQLVDKLVAPNEIQHRVTGQLIAAVHSLASGDDPRRPKASHDLLKVLRGDACTGG